MPLTPKENNFALSKFESMLKTNSVYFFDSVEFEEIVHYYIDSGKINLAQKAIKLGLKQHPNSVILKLLKAELLIFNSQFDEASKLLLDLQAIEPTNEEIYVQQATIFSKIDDHEKAIQSLKTALSFSEDEADILAMIGMEYLYLDNFDDARLNFAKCLEVDYEDYSSLYNIIYCFDMENKHSEAVEYLNTYINQDPYSEVAWHQLGRQYYILENYEMALRAFDYAVLIDEYFVGAYLEKAKTLEQLDCHEEAIDNYKKTIELDDPTSFVYLRIGSCYEKIKHNALAIQYYKKAVHEDPLLDKGWIAMTELSLKEEKFRKALFHINKAIDIDENNALYWRKYAEINLKLNLYEEAIIGFKKCIDLQDIDLVIWIGLSDVLYFIGEYGEAFSTLIKASDYFRDFAEIEYRLAGLSFLLNDCEKGIGYLNNGLRIDYEYHSIVKELFPTVFKLDIVEDIIYKFRKTS